MAHYGRIAIIIASIALILALAAFLQTPFGTGLYQPKPFKSQPMTLTINCGNCWSVAFQTGGGMPPETVKYVFYLYSANNSLPSIGIINSSILTRQIVSDNTTFCFRIASASSSMNVNVKMTLSDGTDISPVIFPTNDFHHFNNVGANN